MKHNIDSNPWHAWNHFLEAPYLGPSDRAAAETLWRRYRSLQKRAGRLELVIKNTEARERRKDERIVVLEQRLRDLGEAVDVLEGSNDV